MQESTFTPHDYQTRAIKLLLSQASGGLFLDPGLGKTVTVLSAYMILHKKGIAGKMLVIAPLRVALNVWPDEIEKWAHTTHLTYRVLHGPEKSTRLQEDADIYIINPEGLAWLYGPEVKNHTKFDILCVDESSKFKDGQTKRFKLLKHFLPTFNRRWILTGTPVPNGLEDLFGQIFILDGGRSLGKYITHFRMNYFQRDPMNPHNMYGWVPRTGAHQEVVNKISPLILQLSAEDYLAMPEIVERTISVKLPAKARLQYKAMEEEFIAAVESDGGDRIVVASHAAVAGLKCRQIANGAVYDEKRLVIQIHDEKLDALESLLEELGPTPVLILYEFDHDRKRIQKRLGDIPVLNSSMDERTLNLTIKAFNAGTVPRLMGHPASMGHGLNLQGACHHVVWFGITWNLEHYDQAIARVYRQGQKADKVYIYHIVAKDTLDETVVKTLSKKDKEQQSILKALANHRKENYNG